MPLDPELLAHIRYLVRTIQTFELIWILLRDLNREHLFLLQYCILKELATLAAYPAPTVLVFLEFLDFLLILLNEILNLVILFLLNLTDALGVNVPILFSRVVLSNMPYILQIISIGSLQSVPSIVKHIPGWLFILETDSRGLFCLTRFQGAPLLIFRIQVIFSEGALKTPIVIANCLDLFLGLFFFEFVKVDINVQSDVFVFLSLRDC